MQRLGFTLEGVVRAQRHVRVPLPPAEEGGVLPGLVRGVRGREHRAARGSHRHCRGIRIALSVLNSKCSSISRAEEEGEPDRSTERSVRRSCTRLLTGGERREEEIEHAGGSRPLTVAVEGSEEFGDKVFSTMNRKKEN
jgi:hypothetical protein